jgi:hypothetical protein
MIMTFVFVCFLHHISTPGCGRTDAQEQNSMGCMELLSQQQGSCVHDILAQSSSGQACWKAHGIFIEHSAILLFQLYAH